MRNLLLSVLGLIIGVTIISYFSDTGTNQRSDDQRNPDEKPFLQFEMALDTDGDVEYFDILPNKQYVLVGRGERIHRNSPKERYTVKKLDVWNLRNRTHSTSIALKENLTGLSLSADGSRLAMVGRHNFCDFGGRRYEICRHLYVLGTHNWNEIFTSTIGVGYKKYHTNAREQFVPALSPNGNTLAIARDKDLVVWDLDKPGHRPPIIEDDPGFCGDYVRDTKYSPDGRFLVTGRSTLRIWNASSMTLKRAISPVSGSSVTSEKELCCHYKFDISPDSQLLVLAGKSKASILKGFIKVWKISTGKLVFSHNVKRLVSFGVSFLDNHTIIYRNDANVAMLDLNTGKSYPILEKTRTKEFSPFRAYPQFGLVIGPGFIYGSSGDDHNIIIGKGLEFYHYNDDSERSLTNTGKEE